MCDALGNVCQTSPLTPRILKLNVSDGASGWRQRMMEDILKWSHFQLKGATTVFSVAFRKRNEVWHSEERNGDVLIQSPDPGVLIFSWAYITGCLIKYFITHTHALVSFERCKNLKQKGLLWSPYIRILYHGITPEVEREQLARARPTWNSRQNCKPVKNRFNKALMWAMLKDL